MDFQIGRRVKKKLVVMKIVLITRYVQWLYRLNNNINIDKELTKQLEKEEIYWIVLLKRVVQVICFLSSRGLTLRGSHEEIEAIDNRNYLGILE